MSDQQHAANERTASATLCACGVRGCEQAAAHNRVTRTGNRWEKWLWKRLP